MCILIGLAYQPCRVEWKENDLDVAVLILEFRWVTASVIHKMCNKPTFRSHLSIEFRENCEFPLSPSFWLTKVLCRKFALTYSLGPSDFQITTTVSLPPSTFTTKTIVTGYFAYFITFAQ